MCTELTSVSGGNGIISIENSGAEWDGVNGAINISTSYEYDGYTTGIVQSSNIGLNGSQIKLAVNDDPDGDEINNTFILNKNPIIPRVVTSGLPHVGVRVPKNEIACKLASLFPITTTSANLSDEEVLSTPKEIIDQLGRDVDLVIDVGKLNSKKPSSIIDFSFFSEVNSSTYVHGLKLCNE